MIIAFSHPASLQSVRLFDELSAELHPHELLSWLIGEPAPAATIQVLLAMGEVPRERLESQRNLELIQMLSAGYEAVDLAAATEAGIWVSNAPAGVTGNASSVAEFAVMLLIGASRQLRTALQAERAGTSLDAGMNQALGGKTVCIVGLGSVGRQLVEHLRPFNVRLLATDHGTRMPPRGVTVYRGQDLKIAVSTADYVVLCVPGSKENENLIDASVFAAMKRGAILVNVARGSVVNEADLCTALRSGRLAAVGLDVLCHEPVRPIDPLFCFPQALITPHIAGETDLSFAGTIHFIGQLVAAWPNGGKPESIVNQPQRPRRVFASGVALA